MGHFGQRSERKVTTGNTERLTMSENPGKVPDLERHAAKRHLVVYWIITSIKTCIASWHERISFVVKKH